jgi:hypothetical protein
MVAAAAEGQVVDVSDAAPSVGPAVVGFAVIARDVAVGIRTPTVLGVEHYSLTG